MNRINKMLSSNQPREQAGVQSGYSTTDNIHVINQAVANYTDYIKSLCTVFIVYDKAFDLVKTSAVLKVLMRQWVEEIYVNILERKYQKKSTATINIHKVSDRIPIRKGKIISLKLFMEVLTEVFKNLAKARNQVNREYQNNLSFVGNIVLMSKSTDDFTIAQKTRKWI